MEPNEIKVMWHIYIVVFKGFKNGYCIAEGNAEMLLAKLIDSFEDVRSLERHFLADFKAKNVDVDAVVVVWYNFLRTKDFD